MKPQDLLQRAAGFQGIKATIGKDLAITLRMWHVPGKDIQNSWGNPQEKTSE